MSEHPMQPATATTDHPDADRLSGAIFQAMNDLPMERSDHIGIDPDDMREVAGLLIAAGWRRDQLSDLRAEVVALQDRTTSNLEYAAYGHVLYLIDERARRP